jgi:hypothetical protein
MGSSSFWGQPVYVCKDTPPLYFLFYFSGIPEIFPYKTPDLEYVNFATPCTKNRFCIDVLIFFYIFYKCNYNSVNT